LAPVLAITGSARGDGNTALTTAQLRRALDLADDQIIDLEACRLEPFRYAAPPPADDFAGVVDRLLAHRHIVFATPVYWYAMSGLMKTFFDRLTDLLISPDGRRLGRALAGRDMWVLATGTDERLPHGFTEPFERTAAYFDMRWRQAFYVCVPREALTGTHEFEEVAKLAAAIRVQ
jgi:multimeric flavodoxin WrbA